MRNYLLETTTANTFCFHKTACGSFQNICRFCVLWHVIRAVTTNLRQIRFLISQLLHNCEVIHNGLEVIPRLHSSRLQ